MSHLQDGDAQRPDICQVVVPACGAKSEPSELSRRQPGQVQMDRKLEV